MSMKNVNEQIEWNGQIHVVIKRKDGTTEEVSMHNLITDVGKQLLRDALAGTASDAKIKYVAVGNSNTAPAAGDTVLGNEIFRKAVTTYSTPSADSLVTTVVLAPGDVNEQIEEIGWFAGPEATNTSGSGIMIARVLYSHLKNDLEQIQIERTDTL